MERTYRIRGRLGHVVVPLIWSAIILAITIDFWPDQSLFRSFLLVTLALAPAIATARSPTQVIVSDDGTCTFRSFVGQRTIRAQRINSIRCREDEDSTAIRTEIWHDAGRITIDELRDFGDFLGRLLELNPAIEVRDLPGRFNSSPRSR